MSNLKGAPGIYIDDFDTFLDEISHTFSDIGRMFSSDKQYLEKDLGEKITSIGDNLHLYVTTICYYRDYLIKCILDKGECCGYTHGELMRFSVGILENIFVLNHCHDVDYQEVLRYNKEHANDPEGGAADEN